LNWRAKRRLIHASYPELDAAPRGIKFGSTSSHLPIEFEFNGPKRQFNGSPLRRGYHFCRPLELRAAEDTQFSTTEELI